jgi:hypothetical protein
MYMPARRMPARRFEREELVAYIHGIAPTCEVVHILVNKRGDSVRFSGALGNHQVSNENKADLEAWIIEAATLWNLNDAIGMMKSWYVPDALEQMEILNNKAAERKKELDASSQL